MIIHIKIMGHLVIINKISDQIHIDLSNIPKSLAWWKPVVLEYLEREGFTIQPANHCNYE